MLTPIQIKVLKQAEQDGGSVELTGIDKHEGWTKREVNAAIFLHKKDYGTYHPAIPYSSAKFELNENGREYLKNIE